MKQIKNFIIFTIIIGFVVLFCISYKKAMYDKYYSLSGEIWELNYQEDIVTVRDFSGCLWSFKGCEDWMLGDMVSMIMNNHNTPNNRYDDQIIKVTYQGSLE